MADNTVLSTNVGTGDTIRTLEDGSSIKWPAGVCAYATTIGTPDVLQVVTTTAGLPVQPQTSATWAVTDNSGSLTVDNAGTFAVQVDGNALTALQLIDNIVLAEDVPHVSGDSGVMLLSVRADAAASSAGTDGDYAALRTDSTGRLWCNVSNTVTVASHAVTNAGTFAVQAEQSGTWNIGTVTTCSTVTSLSQFAGNAIATNTGVVGAGTLRVTLATDVALPAGTNAIGKLTANSGVDIGDVDVTSIIPGTGATNLGKAIDTATGATDTGVLLLATRDDALSALTPIEGDNVQLRTDANGALWVIPSGTITVASHAVTNAGTFAVQESGGALTALQIMDDWDNAASDGASVSGDVTHDAADTGEPVKLGAKAETSLKGITVVADGDRTNLYADADGVLVAKLNTTGADLISEAVSNTDGASTAFTNFSAVASTYNYVTALSVFRTDAGASLAYVDFRDGTAGSVLYRVPLPPTGGAVMTSAVPLFKTSANTALAYDVSSALTTVYISASGYQSKV